MEDIFVVDYVRDPEAEGEFALWANEEEAVAYVEANRLFQSGQAEYAIVRVK